MHFNAYLLAGTILHEAVFIPPTGQEEQSLVAFQCLLIRFASNSNRKPFT